jgi:hypothetical protein
MHQIIVRPRPAAALLRGQKTLGLRRPLLFTKRESGIVKTSLKIFPILIALGAGLSAAFGQAQVQSRQIVGIAGYLSEWELQGAVTEKISAGRREFSGPVTWKHIGLCSVNGPQEKRGEIRVQIEGSGPASRVDATMSLENVQCTYSGHFSDDTKGVMDCSDAKGVPLTFSFK